MNLIPYQKYLNEKEQAHVLVALREFNPMFHEGNYLFADVEIAIRALDLYYGRHFLDSKDMMSDIVFSARSTLDSDPVELRWRRLKEIIFQAVRWGFFVIVMSVFGYYIFTS